MPYKQLNSPYLRERFGLEINPRVFLPSAGLILLFVLLGIFFSGRMESTLGAVQAGVARNAGWVLITVVNGVLGFAIYLLFSRFGRIRLGGPEAEPEFSTFAWLAMLFSAGMGIGLVFWSVAEPISHYAAPPLGEPLTVDAAREAMRFTFYHWGLHPWAIYAIVGLALAFFSYNRGLPLTVRSVFYPLLGRRIYGPFGHAIDAVAVVATLFGVATSLGFGVQQVSTGLSHVFGVTKGPVLNIVLIAAITGMATVSVVTGLDAGIRRISEINLGFAGLLMLFVLVMGPTLFIVNGLIQNIGSYLHYLPRMSTWTEAYSDRGWQNSWTTFYWGWWIAWAPFVGMFIAQISRGRTIREFLLGVLLMPTALTFLWLTVFGGSALFQELTGSGGMVEAVEDDVSKALFVLLDRFPLGAAASVLAIVVLVLFFVTSSDSASLVIDVISAGGHTDPPVAQRIFWAVLEGVVAGVLLIGGGLAGLQAAAVLTGLPFAIVIGFMCVGLYRGLNDRSQEEVEEGERRMLVREMPGQVLEPVVPQFGKGWLLLEWKAPEKGGPVAAYLVRRRRHGEGAWHEVSMCLEEAAVIHQKDGTGQWEYQVVAVNRAGEGLPSDAVSVDFRMARSPHRSAGRPPGGAR